MKLLLKLLPLVSVALWILSCDSNEPQTNSILSLSVEDVSCTEAWLQLKTSNLSFPNNITLFVNDLQYKNYLVNNADTLLYIDSLLPNKNYTFKAVSFYNPEDGVNSNKINTTTLDTTSQNFTWQTFTFGEHSSSVLYDVAIINENDIWAVGEIYMNDSLGNPDPKRYNAVKWNSSAWDVIRIPYNYQGADFYNPIQSVFAFNQNDIWFCGNGVIHWDGNNFIPIPIPTNVWGPYQMNKLWGSSSNDLYIVGNNGNIAHYQNGSWSKIESGTDVNLKDIYGTPDGSTVWVSGYEDFKPTVLLKISNSKIETVFNSRDYLFVNSPDHISGGIVSVWTNNNNFVYVTTWYGLYRKSIYLDPSREEFLPPSGRGRPSSLDWRDIRSRATDINNVFTSGNRGAMHHFNGVTYRTYQELADNGVTYYGLDVKGNAAITCGQKYENGISDKAIITLIHIE